MTDTNSILYQIGLAVRSAGSSAGNVGTFEDFNSAFGSTSQLSSFDFVLESLTDIDLTSSNNTPDDGEFLIYDGALEKWVSRAGTGGTGGTGADGDSAYQVWLNQGNTGTEQDFLDSLKGEDGADGVDGVDGAQGAPGADAGQMPLVTSESRGNGQNVGDMAFETDTKRLIIWDGTMWLSAELRDMPLPPTEISAATAYSQLAAPFSSTQSTTYPVVLQAPSGAVATPLPEQIRITIRDTEANILARTGDPMGTIAFGTDTNDIYILNTNGFDKYSHVEDN